VTAIHRELGSWKSTGLTLLYQCLLSYFIAMFVYVVYGVAIGVSIDTYVYILTAINLAILAYLLVVKDPFRQKGRGA